jgi:hypothetical protein
MIVSSIRMLCRPLARSAEALRKCRREASASNSWNVQTRTAAGGWERVYGLQNQKMPFAYGIFGITVNMLAIQCGPQETAAIMIRE